MKHVVVHPERCVGCMQCMFACAIAHSQAKRLFAGIVENPRPRSRIHVGAGRAGMRFPNRCRHCDPAPCQVACLPGAIFREPGTGTVLIDSDKCINCSSCAMTCPFGVLRFHQDHVALLSKTVAVKCDNCNERQAQGLVPACVETCKTYALTFETMDQAMKRKTDQVSLSVFGGEAATLDGETTPFALFKATKKAQSALCWC